VEWRLERKGKNRKRRERNGEDKKTIDEVMGARVGGLAIVGGEWW
jgi:hypothetical protein